jgi:hypothetical protein
MKKSYIPMQIDDAGNYTTPDWNFEGDNTPQAAATEEWETRGRLLDIGSVLVAEVEDTTEIPPQSEWEALRNACEYEWNPGDPWRKWTGCVEVIITTRSVPKP